MTSASRWTGVSLALAVAFATVAVAGAQESEVAVTQRGLNLPPIGFLDFATILEDSVLVGNVLDGSMSNGMADFDPDGVSVTAVLMTAPVNGTLDPPLASDGSFTYTPNPDVFGGDTFVYLVTDAENAQTPVQVTITINAVPEVTSVTANPGSAIEECGEIRAKVATIDVTFDVPMANPAGDTDPEDVTNPDNYHLIAAGPDQDIGTISCGVLAFGDEPVPISNVGYDGGSATATLSLAATPPDGPLRLLVCDTLETTLDGTATLAETDERTFRKEARNLLVDGQFDCITELFLSPSWEITADGQVGRPVSSTQDVNDSTISGSLEMSGPVLASQCVDTGGAGSLVLGGHWNSNAVLESNSLVRYCDEYDEPQCGGSVEEAVPLSDPIETVGVWIPFREHLLLLDSTESVRCTFGVRDDTLEVAGVVARTGAFGVFFDDLSVELPIFDDGFESGDTSAWSLTTQ